MGSKQRLTDLGIPLVFDQPGVGENLHTQTMSVLPVPLTPSLESESIRPGMKALAFANLDTEDQSNFITNYPGSKDAGDKVIRSLIQSSNEASASLILAVRSGNLALLVAISSFPFSRGNTHISSFNPDTKPVIDVGLLANDLDLEILTRHVCRLREIASTDDFKPFCDLPRHLPTWTQSKASFAYLPPNTPLLREYCDAPERG